MKVDKGIIALIILGILVGIFGVLVILYVGTGSSQHEAFPDWLKHLLEWYPAYG